MSLARPLGRVPVLNLIHANPILGSGFRVKEFRKALTTSPPLLELTSTMSDNLSQGRESRI
jgi:hypothetical protein